jgi:adenosylmethionine-8-amino-7-oxononanoate aminotransferase
VLAPPLIITQAEADLILDGIDQAVAAATKALKL